MKILFAALLSLGLVAPALALPIAPPAAPSLETTVEIGYHSERGRGPGGWGRGHAGWGRQGDRGRHGGWGRGHHYGWGPNQYRHHRRY